MDIDQETDSDFDGDIKGTQWHDNASNSNQTFTLNLEVCEDKEFCESSCSSDLVIATNDEGNNKNGARKKKRKRISIDDEIPIVFQEMEEEIERQLDAKASKSKLSVTNVKNILKSVITNEDVMAMVRHTMLADGDDNWLTYEPKLTRAKAKELMKAQSEYAIPIYTPKKKQSECQMLIEKELSEDSSDDEYRPIEEEQSEDEKSSVTDSLSSPVRKVSTPVFPQSPDDQLASEEDAVANVECGTQTYWTEDGLFKIPQPRPEVTERVEENIGQRTRSKLPLNNTPLQVIESAFIPPDITTDMYDSDCDDEDWKAFLKDFALNNEDNENVDDDDVADPEYNVLADFEVQTIDEEELRVDKAVKISRKEKKVLMAEAHEPLFSDDEDNFALQQCFPAFENPELHNHQNEDQEKNDHAGREQFHEEDPQTNENGCFTMAPTEAPSEPVPSKQNEPICVPYVGPLSPPPSPCDTDELKISETQLAILKQQLCQYVQILTQNFLQTFNNPVLSHHAESCKSLLVNLKCLTINKVNSNFEASNLNWAVELVEYWERRLANNPTEREEISEFFLNEISTKKIMKKKKYAYKQRLPKQLMHIMANSKVFIYPLLLPETGFQDCGIGKFSNFNLAEEHLLALGLEQFIPHYAGNDKLELRKIIDDVICSIHQNMLPTKDCARLKRHVLESKKRKNNAIRYYFSHGKAPQTVHHVVKVDWNDIKCPRFQPSDFLPEIWAKFVAENYERAPRIRESFKIKKWSKFAVPVIILGEFPDEQTAREFSQGTLDYSIFSGKYFRMLPSMPLITNVSKDITDCNPMSSKLPKVLLTVDNSSQTKTPQNSVPIPSLSSTTNSVNKKASPLKQVLKKYNSHRKVKGSKNLKSISPTPAKVCIPVKDKPSPRTIAPNAVVVIVPPEDTNIQENQATSSNNILKIQGRVEDSVVHMPEITSESGESTPQTPTAPENSETRSNKKDNEDELAALMLASSTIRVPGSNLERKRKSKQQRDTDANLALLSPEKGSAMEEKDTCFAQAFFRKVRERLLSSSDCSRSFEAFVQNLYLLVDKRSSASDDKDSDEVEDVLGRLLEILAPHRDLVEEFPIFLNSQQALRYGCFGSYLSAVQMRDFMHKLEVYFAKQPSHVNKIVSLLSDLNTKPNVTYEDIKDEILPLLKGNTILINHFLRLLPHERPPDSLMTDFEELEFWEDADQVAEEEPVETVRLPEREPEDRLGGESCVCSCHSPPSSSSSQNEKDSCRSHCIRCSLKFVNGRVVLQTAKGIRPARVSFSSPADFQRLIVKESVVPPTRPGKGRARKKGKATEGKEDATSPPPKVRALQGVEPEEDLGSLKFPEMTASPRSQPRSSVKGTRTPTSKGKDSRINPTCQKAIISENANLVERTAASPKQDNGGDGVASVMDCERPFANIGKEACSSDQETTTSGKSDSLQSLSEKCADKSGSLSSHDEQENLEVQQCSTISAEESMNKNDQSSCGSENGSGDLGETPWTREEDRIILQTFQMEGGKSDTLVKIKQKLPERSVTEIASRFHKLMNLFRKMTGPSTASSETEDIDLEKDKSCQK